MSKHNTVLANIRKAIKNAAEKAAATQEVAASQARARKEIFERGIDLLNGPVDGLVFTKYQNGELKGPNGELMPQEACRWVGKKDFTIRILVGGCDSWWHHQLIAEVIDTGNFYVTFVDDEGYTLEVLREYRYWPLDCARTGHTRRSMWDCPH